MANFKLSLTIGADTEEFSLPGYDYDFQNRIKVILYEKLVTEVLTTDEAKILNTFLSTAKAAKTVSAKIDDNLSFTLSNEGI